MSTLMEIFGTAGHGNQTRVRSGGNQIGYTQVHGDVTHYYDRSGSKLGRSFWSGNQLILEDNRGRVVGRYR